MNNRQRTQAIPFFLLAIFLSLTLHLTALTALPLFKSLTFDTPRVQKALQIHLQRGMQSVVSAVKKSVQTPRDVGARAETAGRQAVDEEDSGQVVPKQNAVELVRVFSGISSDISNAPATETKERKDTSPQEPDINVTGGSPAKSYGGFPRMSGASRETFLYDIYWLGLRVGSASIEASNDNGLLTIRSRANSSGLISTFYKVDDYAESVIKNGLPVHFKIKQREGKYRSDKETIFDADSSTIEFFNHLKGTHEAHSLPGGVAWDMISGFFYLRTQPLEIGKPVHINIFDSNKFYSAEVSVLRKDRIGVSAIGGVNTVIVKPELKSEGLFQRKGDVLIWLTDDEKRIPVRVETKVPVGDVVAELRAFRRED